MSKALRYALPSTLTIKRLEWRRGKINSGPPFLVNQTTGMKCCLGFACLAAGLTLEQIGRHAIPCFLRVGIAGMTVFDAELKCLMTGDYRNLEWVFEAAMLNDMPNVSENDREYWLTDIFAKNHCDLAFKD